MKVERWCWCIIMSNHFCHTLLRSSYCWLCVLQVNPISNKRCLLCISIVGLPEEQTLEIDTLCGIYMSSFHFSSSSELPNNSLPLPLWQSTSFHPSWPLIVVCLLWESRVIQYPMESYHSAKHIIPLLIVVCSTEKRGQYISPSCHLIIQSNSYFFWSQWFISLFRDWYVQHKSPLSFQWQVLERSDWFKKVNCLDNHLSWPEGVQYSLIYLHSHIHQLAKNLWTWLFPASTSPLSSETLYDGGIPSRFNPREVCAASESMKRVRSVNPCKYAIIYLPSSDDAHCKWLLLAVWFKKLRRVIN